MSKLKKLASGIGWGTFSTITVTGFQLVFMAVMARLLEPADFGLVAIANVCLRFFSYFAQMGTGPALIQKTNLEEGDIAAALSVSIGISFIFFLLAQALAPLFEYFYQMPQLGNVIRALSINFIIGGFSTVSIGLLQRNTAFRAIAIIEVISYVIGYGVVGLTAAYHDFEVWALVAAFMTQMTTAALLSYAVARYPLRFIHNKIQRQHFLSYGGRYSIIGFTEFLTSNLDALIIGKLLGAAPAGFYNRALLLANLPVQNPANILTKALFPIMSSVGNQHGKQVFSLQLSILLVGSYAFAVSVGIFIAAPDIVKVLLGNKWLDSIPILQVLSWSVGPAFISHVSGITFDSLNELRLKLKIQLWMVVLIISLMFVLAPSGKILYIAVALVIMEWVRFISILINLSRLLSISFRETTIVLACIAIITSATGSSIYLLIHLMNPELPNIYRLITEIAAGGLGLIFGFILTGYLAIRLPAVRFLVTQAPICSRFFPKFA